MNRVPVGGFVKSEVGSLASADPPLLVLTVLLRDVQPLQFAIVLEVEIKVAPLAAEFDAVAAIVNDGVVDAAAVWIR